MSKDLDTAITNMADSHRECRDWHHDWKAWQAWRIKGGGWEERRRCKQCGSVVVRILNRRGYVVSRRIVYAEGYLMKGLGRLDSDDRGQLRLFSVAAHETGVIPDA